MGYVFEKLIWLKVSVLFTLGNETADHALAVLASWRKVKFFS